MKQGVKYRRGGLKGAAGGGGGGDEEEGIAQ